MVRMSAKNEKYQENDRFCSTLPLNLAVLIGYTTSIIGEVY